MSRLDFDGYRKQQTKSIVTDFSKSLHQENRRLHLPIVNADYAISIDHYRSKELTAVHKVEQDTVGRASRDNFALRPENHLDAAVCGQFHPSTPVMPMFPLLPIWAMTSTMSSVSPPVSSGGAERITLRAHRKRRMFSCNIVMATADAFPQGSL